MKLSCEICGLEQMPKGPLGQMIRVTHKFVAVSSTKQKMRIDAKYAHKFCLDRAKLEVESDIKANS